MISYPFTSRVTYDAQNLPIYDRAVDSAFLRRFYKAYWDDGVFYKPSTSFAVTATGTGMNVQVQPGMAQVQGAFCLEDTVQTLPIAAADASLNRIDSVVLRLDLSLDKRDISLAVISGVAAVSPVAPALTRNNTTWELGIANVLVSAGAGVITQRDVEDTRLDDTRCGAVAQTVGDLDTSGFFAQLTAMIARLREEIGEVETGTAAMLRSVYDPGDDGVNICVQEYECSKSGSVYALTGEGAVGRFKVPAAWSAGDTWTVNGVAVPAYCGADVADGDCVVTGRWVLFTFDGTRLDFNGGGGLSAGKLAQATATEADVLANSTFYAKGKTLRTGNVPRRGDWGATIAPGESVTVPDGKHDGGGRVSAKALKTVTITMATGEGPWSYTFTGGTLVGIRDIARSGDSSEIGLLYISGNTITMEWSGNGTVNRQITLIYY
nr:MAG TPA: Receptor Binding Protein [Caudoviricetes sp.]